MMHCWFSSRTATAGAWSLADAMDKDCPWRRCCFLGFMHSCNRKQGRLPGSTLAAKRMDDTRRTVAGAACGCSSASATLHMHSKKMFLTGCALELTKYHKAEAKLIPRQQAWRMLFPGSLLGESRCHENVTAGHSGNRRLVAA